MTYDDQNVFSFHLNESLWFKRGQEVDEFMGISLEPDIAIQENDDTVSIRGVIELAGEYFQSESAEGDSDQEEESQVLSLRDHASKRTIENIDTHEDGVSEFYHRFPVEVSIPKHRIHSLEDVTVSIDSFDYELPEQGHLKLNATVAIHGVQEERTDEASQVEEREAETEPADELEESFSIDQKFVEPVQETTQDTSDTTEEEEDAEGRWNFKKKSQSFAEFFGQEQEEDQGDDEYEEESPEYYDEEESRDEIEVKEQQSDSDSDDEEAPDARYLTSMFQREEEPYAKMKMCIVQEQDTLGTIAQRYKVPPTHLSRVNKLGDEDVSAGQILYIPTKQ
ncbi:stage VI sporulation protein D [Pontibacillus marinus]|uniref:Stage VI sporulation protein D n=1 Tax=Pontibacillus marinus BH030004 = DSM 16465 TaxID=1385511 RepID=A0A0A5GA48_9BACI|nr:stage VI sporulation protein D [Pontibacillus marinus]KGX88058.1 stage VI sporulation protein D [Pontibacillus marinus BH030004 = DSM 16465]